MEKEGEDSISFEVSLSLIDERIRSDRYVVGCECVVKIAEKLERLTFFKIDLRFVLALSTKMSIEYFVERNIECLQAGGSEVDRRLAYPDDSNGARKRWVFANHDDLEICHGDEILEERTTVCE